MVLCLLGKRNIASQASRMARACHISISFRHFFFFCFVLYHIVFAFPSSALLALRPHTLEGVNGILCDKTTRSRSCNYGFGTLRLTFEQKAKQACHCRPAIQKHQRGTFLHAPLCSCIPGDTMDSVLREKNSSSEKKPQTQNKPCISWWRNRLNLVRRRLAPVTIALLTTWMATKGVVGGTSSLARPEAAHAALSGMPVLPPDRAKLELQRGFLNSGMQMARQQAKDRVTAEAQLADAKFMKDFRRVYQKEGGAAAEKFKEEYEESRRRLAEAKIRKKKRLIWDLIQDGIDPNGVLGTQILFEWEHGIDLEKIPETDQQRLKGMRVTNEDAFKARLRKQEKKFRNTVEDLKEDNVDLVEYFYAVGMLMERAEELTMSGSQEDMIKLADEQTQLEMKFRQDGRASPKRDYTKFRPSSAVVIEERKDRAAEKKAEKERRKRLKVEQKRKKEFAKTRKKLADNERKEETLRVKKAAKIEKQTKRELSRLEKKPAKEREMHTSSVRVSGSEEPPAGGTPASEGDPQSGVTDSGQAPGTEPLVETGTSSTVSGSGMKSQSLLPTNPSKGAATVVAAGLLCAGGVYVLNVYKGKSEENQKERQRQYNLIMGLDKDRSGKRDDLASSDNVTAAAKLLHKEEEIDGDDGAPSVSRKDSMEPAASSASKSKVLEGQPASATPTTKKRGVLGSIFQKQTKTGRETSMGDVFSELRHPSTVQYARVLAKYLTVGAPGRFPHIEAMVLPDSNNVTDVVTKDRTFQLDVAKEKLIERKAAYGLTESDVAETFANVANVMVLELVDLASSATEMGSDEKAKNKAVVDALNVVLDFMDHAASLFDAVASEVTIEPVTYEGTLGKSKLEQMYTAYAGACMSTFDEKGQERLDTLQLVFNIRDKKAEALTQKIMMKNLMKMMKEGGDGGMEGMEGMAEMMAAMGGGDGSSGLEGMADLLSGSSSAGDEIGPEELKQSVHMMKQLIDSGSVSKEELDLVRNQFKEIYGTDISELVAAADKDDVGIGEDGKELLDLFKTVLEEKK